VCLLLLILIIICATILLLIICYTILKLYYYKLITMSIISHSISSGCWPRSTIYICIYCLHRICTDLSQPSCDWARPARWEEPWNGSMAYLINYSILECLFTEMNCYKMSDAN